MRQTLRRIGHAVSRRLTDRYWETRFGVTTETPAPAVGPDSRVYVTLPYRAIFHILDRLALGADDMFVEIGCGKGRVLLAATRYPVAEIVGLELSTELADMARSNLGKQMLGSLRVEVSNIAAQEFDFSRGNIFYLYNPFGPDSFRAVLSRLEHGLREHPRPVRIAYVRPCHEDVFGEFDWLERTGSFEVVSWAAQPMAVSVWRNTVPDSPAARQE
jgi:SAM-dependent methyltransferase